MTKKNINQVVIIGGGIAAHTAAIYTGRAKLEPLVLSGIKADQLSLTTEVENFPGFPQGVLGPDLISNAKKQAQKFGASYLNETAKSFAIKDGYFEITTDEKTYPTLTVIIATGATAKKLGVPGEDQYFGRGVSTCATCDAALYKDKIAVVVGGGDSAMEEVIALKKFAKNVTIVHRGSEFSASQIMQDRILALAEKKEIEIIWDTIVTEVVGDGKFVTGVKLKNNKTKEESELKTNGLFLAIGHRPNTEIFQNKIKLDRVGYIEADKNMHTSVAGVFAAGDVQDHIWRQAVTSAGSGCIAALAAEKYLENIKADK